MFATACYVLSQSAALAEFEIPEVDTEQGEMEIEYRGAAHWGLPRAGSDDDLRQSHEVEIQWGLTDNFMIRVTPGLTQPAGEQFDLTSMEWEAQAVLLPRHGDGWGGALMGGYEQALNQDGGDEPNDFDVGPIVEYARGPLLITLNPRLDDQRGTFADQEGFGFEYAAEVSYRVAPHWAAAVEAFGGIDDLANAGSFNGQVHRIGPLIYLLSSDIDTVGDKDASPDGGGDGEGRHAEWRIGVGALFGLTDATSDVALKLMASTGF